MAAHLAIWFVSLGLIMVLSQSASIALAAGDDSSAGRKTPSTQPTPSPKFSPKDVAKIVVDALGNNDGQDNGIITTWKFTSPGNQQVTGPIQKFIPMVKGPAYLPMLNHKSALVRELLVDDGVAAELAIVTDSNGIKAYFIFQLSKQTDGALKGCWLTDGVMRVTPKGGGEPDTQKIPDGEFPA